MIKLTTDCKECMHNKVCMYKDNVLNAMNIFKSGFYDGYRCDDLMKNKNVDVTFSCPDFRKRDPIVLHRG